MQIDPGLKQILLRKTGSASPELVSDDHAQVEIAVAARLVDPSRVTDALRVVARFGTVVTARVPLGAIARMRADPNVASLKASRGFAAALASSVADIGASDLPLSVDAGTNATGTGVVVAVIDWGCDFVHANFRRADGGTRLLAIWDQRGGTQPLSPAGFGYGRLLDRAAIDDALHHDDPYAALDYDPAEIDPAGAGTHGTHVLDIAAGNGAAPGSSPGVARNADLLFVHLRGDDTLPTDTLGDSVSLLEAVRFVFDYVGDRPVVLNLSMGRHGGPHDGTTLLERAMDEVLAERSGRAIVMSTGNYFEARVHCAGKLAGGESATLDWWVLPRNDETTALEVWYAGSDRFLVEVVDPLGRRIGPVPLGEDLVVKDGEAIVLSLFHRASDPNNGDHHIEIFAWPAARDGRWQVTLTAEIAEQGTFHAWIERDDPASQSRFSSQQAMRQTTTNTICNGRGPITTGGYAVFADAHALLPFSSSGPTRDGRAKPDLLAPGGSIRAARSSRILDGVRTRDETTVKSGTSMAAPHVTGTVALMFEAAGARRLGIDEVRSLLTSTAQPWNASDEDQQRAGAGRLNARGAVEAMLAREQGTCDAPTPPVCDAPMPVCDAPPPAFTPSARAATAREIHEAFVRLARALPSLRQLAPATPSLPAAAAPPPRARPSVMSEAVAVRRWLLNATRQR